MLQDNRIIGDVIVEITNTLPFSFFNVKMRVSRYDELKEVKSIDLGRNIYILKGTLDSTSGLIQAQVENGRWANILMEKVDPTHIVLTLSEDKNLTAMVQDAKLALEATGSCAIATNKVNNKINRNFITWSEKSYEYSWDARCIVMGEIGASVSLEMDDGGFMFNGLAVGGTVSAIICSSTLWSDYDRDRLIGLEGKFTIVAKWSALTMEIKDSSGKIFGFFTSEVPFYEFSYFYGSGKFKKHA